MTTDPTVPQLLGAAGVVAKGLSTEISDKIKETRTGHDKGHGLRPGKPAIDFIVGE